MAEIYRAPVNLMVSYYPYHGKYMNKEMKCNSCHVEYCGIALLWFPKMFILPFPPSKKYIIQWVDWYTTGFQTHTVIPGGDLTKVQPMMRPRPTWIIGLPQCIPIMPSNMSNELEERECPGHLRTLLPQRKIMRNVPYIPFPFLCVLQYTTSMEL